MAQPSSSHREHGERERHHHRSSHHHHRTISSTTLLLVLSLVLAVLAVMLSLPSNQSITSGNSDPNTQGIWNYLTPKRTQALIAREKDVAQREAEVARREAELLAGAPGGVIPPPLVCPPCAASTTIETVTGPIQTIIKEVVKEDSLAPAGWSSPRVDEILDRELKVAERERDISKREESVNRREHDAARRESWIMEQLIALGSDSPTVEEEFVYEPSAKRRVKYQELPPLIVSETQIETETKTVVQTQFVTVPPPANTRRVASPTPQPAELSSSPTSPRTTAVEIITEEDDDVDRAQTVTVVRPRPTRHKVPSRWFPAW